MTDESLQKKAEAEALNTAMAFKRVFESKDGKAIIARLKEGAGGFGIAVARATSTDMQIIYANQRAGIETVLEVIASEIDYANMPAGKEKG